MTWLGDTSPRVLVVATGEPWPLDSGGRLHLFHVLKHLAQRMRITLLLPSAPQYPNRIPAGVTVCVAPDPPAPATTGPTGTWIERLARRHFGCHAGLEGWLRQHAHRSRFDVVMLNGAVSGLLASACRLPFVWNPQDELVLATLRTAEYGPWRDKPGTLGRAALYAAFEHDIARRAATTIYVSPVDAAYARRWAGAARLAVIQNGVDFDYFQPAPGPGQQGLVTFVGALDFGPNIDACVFFACEVWPRLYARDRARRLRLVGRQPVAAVRALAALPGVELAADVPDVRPHLAQAAVVVIPTRTGGGLKNKVLEACAMQRPVVASLRALQGLSVRHGRDVLAADQPATWAARVERLLNDPARAPKLAQAGHAWVRGAHDWARTGAQFSAVMTAAAGETLAATTCAARPIAAGHASQYAESWGNASAGAREVLCR